ncbi:MULTISPECIES: Nif3-like dinuclear metal center hexameric protein [unclassified Paenibacillus]|uniref:Nif3-like dinuclear metal center hexameric protein n=1 Tax=unclassified Paenibacillus TaxID=185978 RepID=UPI0008398B78|nr:MULTISPECIES: Nif3-like dinuclear metal center hexameric protein [unclassified Paenibacillus]NWL87734.1 transcriptional regulator [Paenibacillus sp. 79R4]
MSISIREVLELLADSGGGSTENGVDGLEYGDPDTAVKGIATAFIASQPVIARAKSLGVNLLITHEGLFYSHFPPGEQIAETVVVHEKKRRIEQSGIAVYRYHDGIHRSRPDGITSGLVRELGWLDKLEGYRSFAAIIRLPRMTVAEIAAHVKSQLDLRQVQIVGDRTMSCERIGVLVGYRGGGNPAIPLFEQENLDLILYGEGPEWETPEYVKDSLSQNKPRALLILGHAASEAPGMKYLAESLQTKLPDLPVHFISEEPLFDSL